jgi:hypothetical protein
LHTLTHLCIHIHTYPCTYIYIQIHTYWSLHSSICLCTHTHTHMHLYVYTYIHTHTHTHAHLFIRLVAKFLYRCVSSRRHIPIIHLAILTMQRPLSIRTPSGRRRRYVSIFSTNILTVLTSGVFLSVWWIWPVCTVVKFRVIFTDVAMRFLGKGALAFSSMRVSVCAGCLPVFFCFWTVWVWVWIWVWIWPEWRGLLIWRAMCGSWVTGLRNRCFGVWALKCISICLFCCMYVCMCDVYGSHTYTLPVCMRIGKTTEFYLYVCMYVYVSMYLLQCSLLILPALCAHTYIHSYTCIYLHTYIHTHAYMLHMYTYI